MSDQNVTLSKEEFAIGERAMCISRFNRGVKECTIVGGLQMRDADYAGNKGLMYMVSIPAIRSSCPSGYWNAYPWQLIKFGLPIEDLIEADANEVTV